MGKKKCMQCKEWITGDIIEAIIGEKSMHFCSESCKEKAEKLQKQREKRTADKDAVYKLICDIFGYKVENTALFNEWKKWNNIADNIKIKNYLLDNLQYLTQVIHKMEDKEIRRILYFSAILRNSLHDYHPKVVEVIEAQTHIVSIDEGYETKYKSKNVRKSFDDIEGDF